LQDILQNRPYLLFDGAMGTYFAERRGVPGIKCEMANLDMPDEVRAIHCEYIAAGAMAIKTNTFAASAAVLGCPMETVLDVVRAGWRIACEAAADRALVFADIGPVPEGDGTAEEYRRIVDAFLERGARRFLFETFAEPSRVLEAARYIKGKADAAVVASFAVHPDGHTRAGISGAALGREMESSPDIDAWGFNCISGPYYLNEYVKTLGERAKPLSVMPNAGYPAVMDGRTVYTHNAEYFARQMAELLARGAAILGGCCGTTPEHIARTARVLERARTPGRTAASGGTAIPAGTAPAPNRFWARLTSGKKVVAVEADPPRDIAVVPTLEGASALREAGADIVTVADSPLARARADSSMIASLVSRRCGVEAMPHLACRDRNLNAMKALLLALHIEGVRNVLVVTGDPVPAADRGEVKGVFDFNSQLLAAYIRDLNSSVFAGDPFRIGAALNINAPNLDAELRRAERKAAGGAEFFLTQPAFGPDAVAALKAARERLGGKLLAGIMPLVGHRNALFAANEIPGVRIPEGVVERFRGLKRAEAARLGAELAVETAAAALPYVDGYFIITPLGRFDVSCELTRQIRSMCHD
jgi:methionine synthase I (cobalamin-dependent)/5,10-methylenetetrahydrofolate reductase